MAKKILKTVIKYSEATAEYFVEDLGNGIELEMVLIPEGTFTMGASKDEKGIEGSELPQHEVTVLNFSMGRYQITQAQWKAVANLPQVEIKLNPELSTFKGDNLPVENVSWYDAVEFCARLSNHTGRKYRLPSEAEWEYACRAGTTTSFHFGETITSELANYNGTYTYGNSPKGEYRGKATPVGSFGVANAFGLYDMHGNVWEWCLDDWHYNYENAPTDGSAWLDDSDNNLSQRDDIAVLRGGSWYAIPEACRSASRIDHDRARHGSSLIGFRVVCV